MYISLLFKYSNFVCIFRCVWCTWSINYDFS